MAPQLALRSTSSGTCEAMKRQAQRGFLLNPYRFGDPLYANVSLLLHCDGVDAATTFTDNGPLGLTVTPGGNAQVDTAQFKFGTASALFDGTGDYLNVATGAPFRYPGDFTIEFWVRPNTTSMAILYEGRVNGSTSTGFTIFKTPTSLAFHTNGTNQITYASSIGTGAWRYIAVCRSGTSIRMFLDGTQVGSTYSSSANFSDGICYLGIDVVLGSNLNGWMDEVRITKAARYVANFTPPTAPFPNS